MAALPTANVRSTAIRNQQIVRFLHAVLLAVTCATTCSAFRVGPLRKSTSKTTIPTAKTIDIRRTYSSGGLDNSTHADGDLVVLKAATVDHEREDSGNHRKFGSSVHDIHTGRVNLPPNNLDGVEMWLLDRLEDCYAYTERHVKCPFFRRRYGDILDDAESLVRFVLVRPYFRDSSHRLGPPMSCRAFGGPKTRDLPVSELLEILRRDWRAPEDANDSCGGSDDSNFSGSSSRSEKGYYVTGRMSTSIYRDDCEFESPDPDLPLRGLRKYIGVAAHLFDARASHSRLLSLQRRHEHEGIDSPFVLEAKWKLSLTINLPWKPQLQEFQGSTLYFLDENHLICRHQETWNMSVLDAFLGMLSVSHGRTSGRSSRCPLAFLMPPKSQQHISPSSNTIENINENNANLSGDCIKTFHATAMEEEASTGG